MTDKHIVEISWSSLWRVFLAGVLIYVAYLISSVLLGVALAIIIASALDPLVTFLNKWRVHRILGTLIIYLFAILILVLILYKAVPVIVIEINNLLNNLSFSSGSILGGEYLSNLTRIISERLNSFSNLILSGGASLLEIASSFLGGVTLVISVLILSFYLTISRDGVERFLLAIVPQSYETYSVQIFERTKRQIGVWLRSQILLSIIVGLSSWLGLVILGVPYAFLLGVIAAILELIPVVGPIFSGSIAVIVALTQSFDLAIYALILFVVIQQLENHVLIPLFMGRQMGLHPALVIVSLLAGAKLAGVVGMIMAVPVMVFLRELVEDWSDQKRKRPQLGI